MTRVATAAGSESDIVDLLSTGRIRTSATWCYQKPGPERCTTTLHMKDGSLVLDGVGCGSFQVPVNGSNGRQSAKIDGNTITVSVTGKNGTGVNTYEVSPDLTQCSHRVECPAGFQAKVFSCSVERKKPTQAATQQGAPVKTAAEIKAALATKAGPETQAGREIQANPESQASPEIQANPEPKAGSETSEQGLPPPAPGGAPVAAQSYMAAAKSLKEQDPTYNSLSAAALMFRLAATTFQAAGDSARAQGATDEAQTLENFIKLANARGGDRANQNQCGVLRGNALQCYDRAARLRSASPSAPSAERGAYLYCVKAYCSAMQSADCPMTIFGKDNAGFCFTTATDDLDRPPQNDAAGSVKQQPGSRSTKAGR
jgi:hypothetical protein